MTRVLTDKPVLAGLDRFVLAFEESEKLKRFTMLSRSVDDQNHQKVGLDFLPNALQAFRVFCKGRNDEYMLIAAIQVIHDRGGFSIGLEILRYRGRSSGLYQR